MNARPDRIAGVVAVSMAVLTATCHAGGDLSPLSPAHARLLSGRELFIDADGAVHVRIAPAPVVRLTHDLLPVTFAMPASQQEALEIAEFPHAGAIVQSEKVLNDIVALLEASGLTKTRSQTHDIDSFVFSKGMEFGEKVSKRDSGFRVTFAALVSNLAYMGQGLKVTKFDYDFAKDGSVRRSEYDLVNALSLDWQTMAGSPPERVSAQAREDLARKMLAMCGKALPPGRKVMRVGRITYGP